MDTKLLSVKLLSIMKLHERYRKFNDPAALKISVIRSVYASMALENQTVSQSRLGELYDQQRNNLVAQLGER